MMNHGFGYRDCPQSACGTHCLDDILGAAPAEPPEKLDLSHLVTQKRNQGAVGTCPGFGISQAMVNCARQQPGYEDFEYPSELQIYIQGRAVEHILKDPVDGCSLDAGLRGLQLGGFVKQKVWPYTPENVARRNTILPLGISQNALLKANLRTHRLLQKGPELYRTSKSLLHSGKGIVGGWNIDGSFEAWTPSKGPWDGMKGPKEGGHCLCLHDYPDGLFRLINSWGENEGDEGFWLVTDRVLDMAIALWVIDYVP
jgi:hypothetical protein